MLKAIVVIGSLLVGGAALAQPEMKKDWTEMKKDRTEMKQKMLAKFDTNKDGKLDKAERVVMHERARWSASRSSTPTAMASW